LVENNHGYTEGDLAKFCRVAFEKSFGMNIPVPEFSTKKMTRLLIVKIRVSK
jgi:hypothetical protein